MDKLLKKYLLDILASDRNIVSVTQCVFKDFLSYHFSDTYIMSNAIKFMENSLRVSTAEYLFSKYNKNINDHFYIKTEDEFRNILDSTIIVVIRQKVNNLYEFDKTEEIKFNPNIKFNLNLNYNFSLEIFLKLNNDKIFLYHLDKIDYFCCGYGKTNIFIETGYDNTIIDVVDLFSYKSKKNSVIKQNINNERSNFWKNI